MDRVSNLIESGVYYANSSEEEMQHVDYLQDLRKLENAANDLMGNTKYIKTYGGVSPLTEKMKAIIRVNTLLRSNGADDGTTLYNKRELNFDKIINKEDE